MHRYPQPGSIVEYLESNAPQIALVLEGDESRLRLLSPNRRESRLSTNRILPWVGPQADLRSSRDELIRILEKHKKNREELSRDLPLLEAWEMAQGEIAEAPASWFAELFDSHPDEDKIAAFGRALLNLKSHFRFQNPFFIIHDAETAEKRLNEEKTRKDREKLIAGGADFLRTLWNIAQHNGPPPARGEEPEDEVARRMTAMLMDRVANPESQTDETLWQLFSKSLPEVPHLPLQLLMAWGKLPPHYNFWLDRADYERGDEWWKGAENDVAEISSAALNPPEAFKENSMPFISLDGPTTRDIDDAFHVEKTGTGFSLTIALACPALGWNFGGSLDKLVLKRATSIYLPEGDLHMLPRELGTGTCSLLAGEKRPALCVKMDLDAEGRILSVAPSLAVIRLAANLVYADAEKILAGETDEENPANAFADVLRCGAEVARLFKERRIESGAVIMDRPEPEIRLEGEGWETRAQLCQEPPDKEAKSMVAEFMIAASAAIAAWALRNETPLLFRTQDVALPKEYAGEWDKPEDLARIIKVLIPSMLETSPRKHAAIGAESYAPVTSPLRRYGDLINEHQIMSKLLHGAPRFDKTELDELLAAFSPHLEGAAQAQRFRPRYWKLLHVKQAGQQVWREGVITEENDLFFTVNFPSLGLFVRGKRHLFDDRAAPGAKVRARLGKVNPLYNEIQIMEAEAAE